MVDSDNHIDKWMCVNKDCLYHTKKEDIFVSTNTLDDKDVSDDDNIEWVCIIKDCVFHDHNGDIHDEDEKSMSTNSAAYDVVKK